MFVRRATRDAITDHAPPLCWADGVMGLDLLRLVLRTYGPEQLLDPAHPMADGALRTAARRLAAETQAVGAVGAELLVLVLHRAWPGLSEVERPVDAQQRGALWDRVVALCCEEFEAIARACATDLPAVSPTA